MTEVLVAILCLFSGAAGALIAWSVTHEPIGSVLRNRIRRQIIVTLKSEQSYRGVLWEADAHAFVLRSAELLNADHTSVVVDGELLVLREDVRYLQRP